MRVSDWLVARLTVDEIPIIKLHLRGGIRVLPVPVVPSAEVAEWQTRYVQGVVSITGRESSNLSFGTTFSSACSSVWIERCPAKAEVVGSTPTKRTIFTAN